MTVIQLMQVHAVTDDDGEITLHMSPLGLVVARIAAVTPLNESVRGEAARFLDAGARSGIVWECGSEPQISYVCETIFEIVDAMT